MWQTRGIPVDAILPVGERPTRESAICPRRLEKASRLYADKMGAGQYAVRGNDEPVYYVDLANDVPCYCMDAKHNGGMQCKHTLYCRMREGDERVLQALGDMLWRAQEHAKELHRQARAVRRTVRKG